MRTGVFIGIDHGGTTTTALVLDVDCWKRTSTSVSMPKQTPHRGWVEHDPEDFLRTSIAAATGALRKAGLGWQDVLGVGISNQGETSMAWSAKTGYCVGTALSWEDRRTTAMCSALATEGVDALVRDRTGVRLDPYFSASKFKWLIENIDAVKVARGEGTLRLGGTDSYVINRLTNGAVHATDAATASRTALFNLRLARWDDDLLNAFGLESDQLPEVRQTIGDFGVIQHPDVSARGIPITADTVDAHSALFAQGCWDSTMVKATYGTGAFVEVNTGSNLVEPDGNLLVFIAWELGEGIQYTLEGGVFAVGSAIDWVVKAGLLPSAGASAELATSVNDANGVIMVPAFTGLAAPHWEPNARAGLFGLGLDTNPGHIAYALLDGIAFQCAEIVSALEQKLDGQILVLHADGGPTRNHHLMQRQADLLGMPVIVSREPNMTALGVALLAALGTGALTIPDIKTMKMDTRLFEPRIDADQREAFWYEWRRGVELVRHWANP